MFWQEMAGGRREGVAWAPALAQTRGQGEGEGKGEGGGANLGTAVGRGSWRQVNRP